MERKARSIQSQRPLRDRLVRPFVEYAKTEATSGVILMIAALAALIWANSSASDQYFSLWQNRFSIGFGDFKIDKPILQWINDGLMSIFFFLVGLEIKREILVGELAEMRKATLPIFAALGGMIVPALLYATINMGHPGVGGWGAPMATDIAFALGVLNLLGSRVPLSLKVFLAAVAIVDDLGAVIVIAVFYSGAIQWGALGGGLAIVVGLLLLNRYGVRSPGAYIVPGVVLWVLFLKSGIHPTIAGVVLAMTIPARVYLVPRDFAQEAYDAVEEFQKAGAWSERAIMNEDQQSAVRVLEKACEQVQMPLQRIEHALQPWVSYLIMPLFALANAGVSLSGVGVGALQDRIGLGILVGLLIGKPLGVLGASYLSVKAGVASLPDKVRWHQMVGVGVVAGIGFTMSLFISDLAFLDATHLATAKVSILCGSLIAGGFGFLLLRRRRSRFVGAAK